MTEVQYQREKQGCKNGAVPSSLFAKEELAGPNYLETHANLNPPLHLRLRLLAVTS